MTTLTVLSATKVFYNKYDINSIRLIINAMVIFFGSNIFSLRESLKLTRSYKDVKYTFLLTKNYSKKGGEELNILFCKNKS